MMVEKRILEVIDACRPGSDDLRQLQLDQLKLGHPELAEAAAQVLDDPQLAKLHQQVQNFDAKLIEAIEDVPVPEGLAERLMTRLEAASADDSAQEASEKVTVLAQSPPASTTPASTTLAQSSWLNRRVAFGVGAAIAASLLVAFSLGLFSSGQQEISHANIESLAQAWVDQITELDDWRSETAPSAYPPSRFVIAQARRWQRFTCSADGQAVVYDLTRPGSEYRATLIVAQATTRGLSPSPPTRPIWTLGRSVAAWQEDGLLYVLVIEGPEHHYRRYIDTKTGPLA